jgi:hypothetical protein
LNALRPPAGVASSIIFGVKGVVASPYPTTTTSLNSETSASKETSSWSELTGNSLLENPMNEKTSSGCVSVTGI